MKNRNKKDIIPIFFAVDNNYAPYLAAALESLKAAASDKYIYEINILIEELDETHKDNLSAIASNNIKIHFCDITSKVDKLCSRLHLRDYYTRTTYYRFFIPDMFPQYDKGLYLDCDIIITRDVAELYNTQMGDRLLCAMSEEIITDIEVFSNYSEIVLSVPKNRYFNAGILVMNLFEMRQMHIEEVFASLLAERTFSVAQDQDYLNVICHGRVKMLNILWNKTPMPYADKNVIPYIVHYKINFKPWKYDGIVYGELFWQFAEKTPYYYSLLEAKNNYSEEEKARDAEQYRALERLAEKETFETLAEQSGFFGEDFFPLDFNIDNANEAFDGKILDELIMKSDFFGDGFFSIDFNIDELESGMVAAEAV